MKTKIGYRAFPQQAPERWRTNWWARKLGDVFSFNSHHIKGTPRGTSNHRLRCKASEDELLDLCFLLKLVSPSLESVSMQTSGKAGGPPCHQQQRWVARVTELKIPLTFATLALLLYFLNPFISWSFEMYLKYLICLVVFIKLTKLMF